MDAMTQPQPELLTEAEHRAIELTAELWNLLVQEVLGMEASRDGDTAELCVHIHGIQRAVLAQAAARAYPGKYRLLGGIIISR